MNKNELWNKFAGKKILMIRNDGTCETNVVVGCDPDIGICFARIGEEKNPWVVIHGRISPRVTSGRCNCGGEGQELLNFVFDQLRSGYCSLGVVIEKARSLFHVKPSYGATSCPYSA